MQHGLPDDSVGMKTRPSRVRRRVLINPFCITNYDRTDAELEELLLFCIAVAGKNAKTTAKALQKYLDQRLPGEGVFEAVRLDTEAETCLGKEASDAGGYLALCLKQSGFGCFRARSRAFSAIAASGLDLRHCSVQDLMRYPGIGPKTARFFVLHSRKDARVAVLDRHVMRWLSEQGVPGVLTYATPASKKRYLELEREFLRRCPPWQTPAQLDLEIWSKYAAKPSSDVRPTEVLSTQESLSDNRVGA